ncbi:hypothetical protein EQH57_0435 [Dictyocoela roeselum]|nr:hypothetical protein EQH57_0435 [Dictyocoela roeselum]
MPGQPVGILPPHDLYLRRLRAIDILYLDLKKSLDRVPHKRLLTKLRALGVVGRFLEWIENWLPDRRQRVVINDESLPWAPGKAGSPRISPWSRNLFTINDNPTRNHGLKLQPKRFNTRPCGDLMTYKIINVWNRLPPTVTASESVDTFMRRLDRILPELDYQ